MHSVKAGRWEGGKCGAGRCHELQVSGEANSKGARYQGVQAWREAGSKGTCAEGTDSKGQGWGAKGQSQAS